MWASAQERGCPLRGIKATPDLEAQVRAPPQLRRSTPACSTAASLQHPVPCSRTSAQPLHTAACDRQSRCGSHQRQQEISYGHAVDCEL